MPAPSTQVHHFVPQFLLRNWADAHGKLQAFRYVPEIGKVVVGRSNPRAVCKVEDLYAYQQKGAENRHVPETKFFTPLIDTPASIALTSILDGGVESLPREQRLDFAAFLISLAARTPEAIDQVGVKIVRSTLDLAPDEYEALRGRDDPPTLSEWAEEHTPGSIRDAVLESAMKVIADPSKIQAAATATWWLRKFRGHQLIISDRPLLSIPRSKAPNGFPLFTLDWLLFLPLNPEVLFCASNNHRWKAELSRQPPGRLVLGLNEESIFRMEQYVYAKDRSLAKFIEGRIERKVESGTASDVSSAQFNSLMPDFG